MQRCRHSCLALMMYVMMYVVLFFELTRRFIDGDLVEVFPTLPELRRKKIVEELNTRLVWYGMI